MKSFRWIAALAVLLTVFAVSSTVLQPSRVAAEDDTAKKQDDPLVKAWGDFKTVRDDYNAKQRAINNEYRGLSGDPQATAEEKKAALEKRNKAQADLDKELKGKVDATKKVFHDLLAKADFSKYSDNKDLLESGLMALAAAQTEAKQPAEAARLYEAYLQYCGTAGGANNVRTYYLPMALASTGDIAKAIKRSRELLNDLDEKSRPGMLVRIGDFTAASGDLKGALKTYDEVLAAIGDTTLERTDPRNRAKADAESRKKVVGTDAPNIDSKTWLGGEATALSALKGKVVILDFWATWCPPCRACMPGLDHIYKENKDKGVIALGVTHYYKNGFLPKDKSDLQKGDSFNDLKEDKYLEHVAEFKKRTELSYPFVMGTDADFKAYGVSGIPHLVVVNKEGKVALVCVGSGNDALIEACVKSLTK